MKLKISLIALTLMMSAVAQASGIPSLCIGKPAAWMKNVLYAVEQAHFRDITADDVKQISNDTHDPVYEVTVGRGKVLTVTCDDSGDNDCECTISEH